MISAEMLRNINDEFIEKQKDLIEKTVKATLEATKTPQFLTAEEVCEMLRIDTTTPAAMISKRTNPRLYNPPLKVIKGAGTGSLFERNDVIEFANAHKINRGEL